MGRATPCNPKHRDEHKGYGIVNFSYCTTCSIGGKMNPKGLESTGCAFISSNGVLERSNLSSPPELMVGIKGIKIQGVLKPVH